MTSEIMSAVVLTAPGELEVRMLPVPAVRPGHVLIRTAYVGLCGADVALYDGSSVYLHSGFKSYPFVFGHEWSGRVAAVADDVKTVSVGDRVVGHNFITCESCPQCRAGHPEQCVNRSEMGILGDYPGAASEYFAVPAKVLAAVPDALDLRSAALLEPASTALHAVTRVGVRDDDLVAVFGTGALALSVVQLAKALGATVHAVGIDEAGLALAAELGADRTARPDELEADRYSVTVEASGSPAAARQAIASLAGGGRAAVLGITHGPVDGLDLAAFVIKNARIEGILSGIRQWDRLIRLAARGTLRLAPLIDDVYRFDEAVAAFTALGVPGRARPKILLDFTDDTEKS